jgi:hypothetical protein
MRLPENGHRVSRLIVLLPAALAVSVLALTLAPDTAWSAFRRSVRIEHPCRPQGARQAGCNVTVFRPVAEGAPDSTTEVINGSAGEGPHNTYTPAQIAKAYEYSPTEGGAGQTIALVDANDDPKIEEDLATFDSYFKISPCTSASGCFTKVSTSGSTTSLPPKAGTESLETTLDVEAAHAVCQTCKILLVEWEGGGVGAGAVNEAVHLGATEVSDSWSANESAGEESDFNHPGVVITASAGDWGYYDWAEIDNKKCKTCRSAQRDQFPSALPTVVSVGGTSLELGTSGARSGETVWNCDGVDNEHKVNNNCVGGGGCSKVFTAPLWQQSVIGWSATGCGEKRLDNDTAALAENFPVYDSYDCGEACEEEGIGNGWIPVGGTSLSSPVVASLFALAGGSGGVSYPAATLYSHFGESAAFYDVTKTGNGWCGGADEAICGHPNKTLGEEVDCEYTTACNAGTGFNGPAGVGTPKGLYGFRSNDFTAVTQTSATLQSRVNPDGSNVTTCEFELGTSTSYGVSGPCKTLPGSGEKPVLVTVGASGLSPNTTYHFRVVTKNGKGTLEGPDIVFTTLRVTAPSVETKGAGSIGETAATAYASVNPRGGNVSNCTFEYGTTTSYGSSASCSALPGSGSAPVQVSAALKLAANTEYHYRISATNSVGTTKGADVAFKTS